MAGKVELGTENAAFRLAVRFSRKRAKREIPFITHTDLTVSHHSINKH